MIVIKRPVQTLFMMSCNAASGLSVLAGDPVTINDAIDGSTYTAGAVGSSAAYAFPVFYGTDAPDSKEIGRIPVIIDGCFRFLTDRYNTGASFTLGCKITAKNGVWDVAAGGDPVVGTCYKLPGADLQLGIWFLGG